MKNILLLVTLLQLFITIFAQDETPAFSKIDKADLEMKVCDLDKDAEAVVLFDFGEVYCNLNLGGNQYNFLRTEFNRHVRIKILNTKGLDRANIKIRYYDNDQEEIKNLTAQTINLDGAGNIVYTKVEKDAIFRKKVNKRYSEVIFTFPDVKPGSVIEYKYKDDAKEFYGVRNWYFQKSIPTILSKYILNFPNELIVTAIPRGNLPLNLKTSDKSSRTIKTFIMTNVPALRDEAFISCDEDYLQQVTPLLVAVDFAGSPRKSTLRNWPDIIKELIDDENFGAQLKKNIPRTSDLDAKLALVKDPYQKMVIIHNYVKTNMLWDESYGIWAKEGVKSAWKNKKGTTGEINLILVNLLKDAGLDVSPLLVSTRANGRINTTVAGYDQFDKVMAYVKIDNNYYVLDATDKYTPANLIPYNVVYSEGLLINKIDTHEWGWKSLWNENQIFDNTTIINADINDKGILNGQASVTSKNYSRTIRMPKLKEGKEKFAEVWLNENKQNIKIDSLGFENELDDSLPLVQNIIFSQKISSSGDYNYFSVNLFSSLDKNPFIADERFSDIFFGANQRNTIMANFTIPNGYQFDDLPKNLKMIMPDTSIIFLRFLSVTENTLSVRFVIEFKKPFYTIVDYPYFQEFYKKMFSLLSEQFVYKKK